MAKMRVYNDNVHPYQETFKGDLVKIPPKGFVLMEEDDAILFRGTYAPITTDGDGQPLPTSYKMIRLVRDSEATETEARTAPRFVDPVTGKQAETQAEYEAMLAEHKDRLVVDEEAEEVIKTRGRPKKTA
jgi:hypothetical protein